LVNIEIETKLVLAMSNLGNLYGCGGNYYGGLFVGEKDSLAYIKFIKNAFKKAGI